MHKNNENNEDDAIKDERNSLLEKYTSHFIWKVCVWEGVGDRTELQHIDPRSNGHQRCVFLVLQSCSTGGQGAQLSAGCCFLYSIISPSLPIPKLNWVSRGPPSVGCWLSLTYLITNWSGLQTKWLPVFTELYNSLIAHSISPHNWPSECVTSAVFGMACLIAIKRK